MQVISVVVQLVSQPEPEANWEETQKQLAAAASAGARLIVLPENFLAFGLQKGLVEVAQTWMAPSGPVIKALGHFCQKHRCWLIAGTLPVLGPDPTKVLARMFVFGPKGQIVAHYDKIHLFDVWVEQEQKRYGESDTFTPGKMPVRCSLYFESDSGDGESGLEADAILSVCYDLRFPELYRILLTPKVRLIFAPSAFTFHTGQAHWHTLLRARAIENQCFVLAPNQGGEHATKRRTFGHSLIVSPWGDTLGELGTGAGLVVASLDFAEQDRIREAMPCFAHRRLL